MTKIKKYKQLPIQPYFNLLAGDSVYFHIVLWVLLIVLMSGIMSMNSSWPYYFYLLNMAVVLPAMLSFTYIQCYWGNIILFKLKKVVVFLLFLLILSTLFAMLIPLLQHFIFFGAFFPRVFEPENWFSWRSIVQNVVLLWFPYFIISLKTFFANWFRAEQDKLIIENKRLTTEIQLMKIKLHPHFLFNTLNNLYAMSTQNNPKTSDYIIKLSDIFRIMLYECNKDFYKLSDEIMMIKNYVELEELRYGSRLKLNLELPENVDDNQMIPPLLFFTFVENSFKHGCRNDSGNPQIEIKLLIDDEHLVFESKNTLPDYIKKTTNAGGYGLENTQKRLDLIYENDYTYTINSENNWYNIYLKIPQLTN